MGIKEAVKSVLIDNYANFEGRASRSEYWYFALAYMIVYFIFAALVSVVPALGLLGIAFLGLVIPAIAVAARRMHDTDHSGWFMLIPIYSLYLAIIKGTDGPNRFGEDPTKEISDTFE